MPRFHTSLTIALGLVATGSLLYAWQLRGRLSELETARTLATTEQTRLQKRITSLEKSEAADLESALAPARPAPTPSASTEVPRPPAPNRDRGNFTAMRDSPEARSLMALQQRSALDGRYASLFRKLNLSPADLEKFKSLLVEKQSAAMDVFATAREQGLNPRDNRDQIRQLVTNFEAETDASIRSTLGEAAYQQYQQYEQTAPQRGLVGQLEQRLSYSTAPLAPSQTEQLVSVLAASAPNRDATTAQTFGPPGMTNGFGGNRGATRITDSVIAQSQSFLTGPQMDALRQLQQEQATQAQLRQQMRDQSNQGNTSATPPKPAGP